MWWFARNLKRQHPIVFVIYQVLGTIREKDSLNHKCQTCEEDLIYGMLLSNFY